MDAQLIYDVGAQLGEDTDFYLRKGFKVVAIEANPPLAEGLREDSGGMFLTEASSWSTLLSPKMLEKLIFMLTSLDLFV